MTPVIRGHRRIAREVGDRPGAITVITRITDITDITGLTGLTSIHLMTRITRPKIAQTREQLRDDVGFHIRGGVDDIAPPGAPPHVALHDIANDRPRVALDQLLDTPPRLVRIGGAQKRQ
jgi:hypothetical protein